MGIHALDRWSLLPATLFLTQRLGKQIQAAGLERKTCSDFVAYERPRQVDAHASEESSDRNKNIRIISR